MLAYIKGILEIKTKGYIVVEAGGLGYKIFMPESTIAKAGNIGDKVQIHTRTSDIKKIFNKLFLVLLHSFLICMYIYNLCIEIKCTGVLSTPDRKIFII